MSETRGKDVAVLGVGAVTPVGRDLSEIARRVGEEVSGRGPRRVGEEVSGRGPRRVGEEVSGRGPRRVGEELSGRGPRRVSDELLSDPSMGRNLRRADRFTRMAVMAAGEAWKAAGESLEGVAPERVGIILSSGLGPHCRGFKFLDGMLDEGDAAASPTDFSHSVHGAACAYITALLDVRGPSLTLTDFEEGFGQAVLLARTWLEQGACDRVLLGAVEEVGEVLLQCAGRMVGEDAAAGEGAVFVVVGAEGTVGQKGMVDVEGIGKMDWRKVGAEDRMKGFGSSASASAFGWLGEYLRKGKEWH